MSTNDRETVVVTNSGGSGAGWFIAGVVVVALTVAGLFYFGAFGGSPAGENGGSASIELNVPANGVADEPAANGGSSAAPAPAEQSN